MGNLDVVFTSGIELLCIVIIGFHFDGMMLCKQVVNTVKMGCFR